MGASHDYYLTNTFEGKPWKAGDLPSDTEIVAAIFCAILDNSTKFEEVHLFDNGLSQFEIWAFKEKKIALVNKQPKCLFRAHFEFIINR